MTIMQYATQHAGYSLSQSVAQLRQQFALPSANTGSRTKNSDKNRNDTKQHANRGMSQTQEVKWSDTFSYLLHICLNCNPLRTGGAASQIVILLCDKLQLHILQHLYTTIGYILVLTACNSVLIGFNCELDQLGTNIYIYIHTALVKILLTLMDYFK